MKVLKFVFMIIGTISVIYGLYPTIQLIKMCIDPAINIGVGQSFLGITISIILVIFLYLITVAFILALLTLIYNLIDIIREEAIKEKNLEKK